MRKEGLDSLHSYVFQSLSMLRYCSWHVLAVLLWKKQKHTSLKLFLAAKLQTQRFTLIQQSFSKSLQNVLIQTFVTFEKQKHPEQYVHFVHCILDTSTSQVSLTISEATEKVLTLVLRAVSVKNWAAIKHQLGHGDHGDFTVYSYDLYCC